MLRARGLHALLPVALALALTSCADTEGRVPGAASSGPGALPPPPPAPAQSACVDLDGDGFGEGCFRGPDCNDRDPAVTDRCRACLRPAVGCPCAEGEEPVPCNLETGTTEVSPEGVCHLGQRVCRGGAWSECEALQRGRGARVLGEVSTCYGECDPTCSHYVDCITPGDALPAGSTVTVSNLAQAVFCPPSTPDGGLQPWCERRPGGPYTRAPSTLAWVDACSAPGAQVVLAGADEGVATVAIPFSFSYWGVPYRTVNVTPNGVAQFASATSQWVNTSLPALTVPNSVFAFWDDLQMRTGVCVATVGAAPDRRTLLQWNDAGFYPGPVASSHLTFQVVLSEAGQTVDVLYNTMLSAGDLATGSSATIGVQEGGGTRYDLVGYNTAGVVGPGVGFRWTPTSNDQYCAAGVYRRQWEATCPAGSVPTLPTWGMINFSSYVTGAAAIRMEVRAADDAAALASAPAIRLPDAPRATTASPETTGYDLGDILYAASPDLAHARYVELTAYFDPGPDENLAPQLGSVEVQFRCRPVETPFRCEAGSECLTTGPCHRGVISCAHPVTPVCVDDGLQPVGTTCGLHSVCNAAGDCVPCNEGARCDTGNVCEFGRVSCATGEPVCVRASYLPAGTVCSFDTGSYNRGASPFGWIDACSVPGATIALSAQGDGVTTDALPFGFRFYGTVRNEVGIDANGLLTFPPAAASQWTNAALPTSSLGDAIAPFWDDLQTRTPGVCTATFGRVPSRLYVVEWSHADFQDRSGTGPVGASLDFEVVLEEATQAVNVIYGAMTGDARATGSSATIGIQRGDLGSWSQVGYNTSYSVRSNSSVRWSPPTLSQCDAAGTCLACVGYEVCDNLDNDCNALVDDGIPSITCGVGVCQRTVPGCVRGAVPVCTPGAPSPEVCNGLDDDCDGMVDEALPAITCGVGACQRTVAACVSGVPQTCTPGAPSAEVCDNVDNDCDGLVDDGLTRSCYTGASGTSGVGVCHPGTQTCVAGSWGATCPGQVVPSAEYCNGRDDDCDGFVDDACIGVITCPADVTMFAGDTTSLTASPRGIATTLQWSIVSGPPGATGAGGVQWSPAPPTGNSVSARPMLVGAYRMRVSGVDYLGGTRTCEFNLTANNRGVRVELTWDGDGDVDLHLHDGNVTSWFNGDDCYYADPATLWGANLDLQNATSNGPETIRVDTPAASTGYYIGVHNEARGNGRTATVRVFCGGSGTTPAAVFVSSPLSGNSSGNCNSVNTFWRVAGLVVRPDGGCDVTPINTYTVSNDACMRL